MLLGLALALAGCDGARSLEAPGEVAFVAVVEDEARSPLVPVGEAATLVAGDLEGATVLGYTAAQLDPAIAVDAAEPLALSERGCGLLPPASWARRWEDGAPVEVAPPALPLSAGWMRAGCPTPEQLHVTCRSFQVCSGRPQPLDAPCSWSVGCGDGQTVVVHAGVWPGAPGCAARGGVVAPLDHEVWSAARDDYHARVSLGGSTCAVEGRSAAEAPLPIRSHETVRVWNGNPRSPGTLDNDNGSPFVDSRTLRGGGVTGFVLDLPRRRAIVAATDTAVCPTLRTNVRGAWRTVDLDDVVLSSTTAGRAPACLMGVRQVSPEGSPLRLVGFTVDNAANTLTGYEFDQDLRQIRRAVLTRVLPDVVVADVLITPERWWVLTSQSSAAPKSSLHTVDPVSLTVTATLAAPLGAGHALEATAAGGVDVSLRDRADVCRVDPQLRTAVCSGVCGPEVFSPATSVIKFTAIARDPADGSPVLAASDAFHGLFVCGDDLWLQPPGGSPQMTALLPVGPGRFLTAAVGRWGEGGTAWQGRLMVADRGLGGFERRTWSLPGSVVSAFAREGERLWMLMPFDGLLVRWTPPSDL